MAGSQQTLIVICADGHLFRSRQLIGSPGDTGTTGCPVCATRVGVRVVDPRMLSQEALAEAWQRRGVPW